MKLSTKVGELKNLMGKTSKCSPHGTNGISNAIFILNQIFICEKSAIKNGVLSAVSNVGFQGITLKRNFDSCIHSDLYRSVFDPYRCNLSYLPRTINLSSKICFRILLLKIRTLKKNYDDLESFLLSRRYL